MYVFHQFEVFAISSPHIAVNVSAQADAWRVVSPCRELSCRISSLLISTALLTPLQSVGKAVSHFYN